MGKIKFKRFFTGVLLFVVSIILTVPLTLISFLLNPIYYVVSLKWQSGFNALGDYFRKLAVSVDQFGNASCKLLFDFILIKKKGYKFGDIDDTVSYILGRNYYKGTLTILGRFIVFILNLIDKEHITKAICLKIESDQEALLRIQNDEYFK